VPVYWRWTPTVRSPFWQISQQPEHEPADPPPGLDPGEPPGHPFEQSVGLGVPAAWSYAVARGHRLIF
jgi:hypothetical protein